MPNQKQLLVALSITLMAFVAPSCTKQKQTDAEVAQPAVTNEASPAVNTVELTPETASESVEAVAAAASDSQGESETVKESPKESTAEAVPLDLAKFVHIKASVFDKITQFPWPGVPRGSQKFAGVPLEISGAVLLWGERNANAGQKYPEHIKDIPIQRPFETLYVCHAAFFEGVSGVPLCEIVLHYDDATTASDKIVCGEDARDWFANRSEPNLGPTGTRSVLAWDGDAQYGTRTQAIRFCLTGVANPHPDKTVTAIDLVSPKTKSAACIIGITTGPSTLMTRKPEPPAKSTTE